MKSNLFIEKTKKVLKIWAVFTGIYFFWWFIQIIFGVEKVGYSNIFQVSFLSTEWVFDLFNIFSLLAFCSAMIWKIFGLRQEFNAYKSNMNLEIKSQKILATRIDYLIIGLMVIYGFCWVGGFVHKFDIFIFFILIFSQLAFFYLFKQLCEKQK